MARRIKKALIFLGIFVLLSNHFTIKTHAENMTEHLTEAISEWDYYVIGSIYLCDSYEIQQEPSYNSAVVAEVMSGQTVRIVDEVINEYDEVWTKVLFYAEDEEKTGYVERVYIACSNEAFLRWEEEKIGYVPTARDYGYTTFELGGEAEQRTAYPDIEAFPESYRDALYRLREAHPNWTFVAQRTGLDWNEVLDNELVDGRSLIPASYPEYMSAGPYSKSWKNANRDILSYYMDPRNGLTETGIFQFEQLTYNASYHVEASIQLFLNQTFMSGNIPGEDARTYANVFWNVGSQIGVSPFHLASRVYQEQGQGTSMLISGTYPGFEGYYNYFNIGASGTTDREVVESGLTYAKQQNWNSVYSAINGGAIIISTGYILQGQDTIYLQKFDVDASAKGLYWHQYMQNIVAPTSEAKTVYKQYADAGSLENTFVFKIPIYENMPTKACQKPNGFKLTFDKPVDCATDVAVIDGINYVPNELDGRLTLFLENEAAKTAVFYQYNENNNPVGMRVYTLSYDAGNQYIATEQTELRDLLSYHGFSMRITGITGLRVEMGISATVREQMTSEAGLNGWKLKNYGTLLMNKANYETLPMIRGGEKVGEAIAYGEVNGTFVDNVFQTVGDRYHYTAVLTNIPVRSYKQDLVFRSMIVLERDGQEFTIYGPVVNRSLYRLAEQLVAAGIYPEESAPGLFLKQIITDADAYEVATVTINGEQ